MSEIKDGQDHSSAARYGKFAVGFLQKQGWSQGCGLGKTSQGIPSALKPSLKFDTTGIGHDPAKEFVDRWWEDAYKKAANRIEVEQDNEGDGVDVKVKTKQTMSKKELRAEKRSEKKSFYSSFVKSGTLTDGIVVVEAERDLDDEGGGDRQPGLTDEELFRACGGLTAHKGARHGHRMSGKQARIDAMDRKLAIGSNAATTAETGGGGGGGRKPSDGAERSSGVKSENVGSCCPGAAADQKVRKTKKRVKKQKERRVEKSANIIVHEGTAVKKRKCDKKKVAEA